MGEESIVDESSQVGWGSYSQGAGDQANVSGSREEQTLGEGSVVDKSRGGGGGCYSQGVDARVDAV